MSDLDSKKYNIHKRIYPFVSIICNDGDKVRKVTIETFIRKKHTDGKWYLQLFRESAEMQNENKTLLECEMVQIIDRWHKRIYYNLICGIVVPTMKLTTGENLFELDENQDEETERIKNTFW